jgi:hypothetical protein
MPILQGSIAFVRAIDRPLRACTRSSTRCSRPGHRSTGSGSGGVSHVVASRFQPAATGRAAARAGAVLSRTSSRIGNSIGLAPALGLDHFEERRQPRQPIRASAVRTLVSAGQRRSPSAIRRTRR